MVATAFVAALAGALVAPAISAGLTRVAEFRFPELPQIEISLPESETAAADGDAEVTEARAGSSLTWRHLLTNLVTNLAGEAASSGKFNKFLRNNL